MQGAKKESPMRVVVLYSAGHLGSTLILNRLLKMSEHQRRRSDYFCKGSVPGFNPVRILSADSQEAGDLSSQDGCA